MSEESASPDLVVLTQSVFDAVDRGDLDGAFGAFAPDAIWVSEVLETTFEGMPSIRRFIERWTSVYEAFDVQTEDILDVGNGVVLCVFMNRSHDPDGAGEPTLRFALVILWADGAIQMVTGDEDIAGARATADRLARERADG
jgi:ketosteroid isomerase-like protein